VFRIALYGNTLHNHRCTGLFLASLHLKDKKLAAIYPKSGFYFPSEPPDLSLALTQSCTEILRLPSS
jgi:hypothetical protein